MLVIYLLFRCVCVPACLHVYHRGQKRVLDPLELELRVLANWLMWVLGTEPRSSVRAASALNISQSHVLGTEILLRP